MRNQSSVQVVCAEYQGLLNESQVAFSNWAYERVEISGRRGRDVYNELRTLQGDFLKAWALLQNHKCDCEVCQVISTTNSQIPLFRRVKQYHLWSRILQKNRRNIQEDDRLIGDPRDGSEHTTKGNYE